MSWMVYGMVWPVVSRGALRPIPVVNRGTCWKLPPEKILTVFDLDVLDSMDAMKSFMETMAPWQWMIYIDWLAYFFVFFRWFSSLQAVIIAKGYLQWTYHFKPKHGYNEQQMFLFFQVELLRFKIYVPPTRDFDPASENCTLRDLCRFAASCLCHKLGEPQPLSTGLQAFKQNFKPGQLGIKMYK